MMQQELKLVPVEDGRPLRAAFVIGMSAFVGSMIPLAPFVLFYVFNPKFENGMHIAMYIVLVLSALVLFVVGVVKSNITVGKWYKSGLQMAVIGIVSALFGYLVGMLFSV